ncbi:related to RCC1 domain [Ramularia collo-cygni]|uniref:Related to RCC1 domain n=1 Tax=Ramularia collo-cygni TaxID=112498 RepID=A0A2D3V784_9PEZI|nr:related to RCC1 domain [Ramularia collo-cygni]CZT16213.1 related to RCC1 domain [Ramularia collo-cygni]
MPPKANTKAARKAPPKKAAAAKKAPPPPPAPVAEKPSRKRKADDAPAAVAPVKKAKIAGKGAVLQEPPSQRLHVYVFGEGTAGELGLGTAKNAVDVKRPRLNPNLSAESVGVVEIAAGGMHCIALTHDNKILTWGVNDQGTLGRDTTWDGGLKDMDEMADDSDSESGDDNGLNPNECTPGEVDWSQTELAPDTRFVQVAAGDSSSFVLTDDGKVYGWGTFRSNDGIFGFTPEIKVATRPVLVQNLKQVTSIKAGANHALAMQANGAVFAWGSGQQNQLGRRIIERTKTEGLLPREFGLPKGPKKGITSIETGTYHSFAISKTGDVWSWGLNNFGETGIMDNAGEDDAVIMNPRVVESLKGKNITSITGGGHHSIAATADGECLAWGRIDGHQIGISDDDIAKLPASATIQDDHGRARIVAQPTKVNIDGHVTHVASASDHNIVVTKEGQAWSWGFSANYQTGLGTDDDVEVATRIANTAIVEKKVTGATTGGQFSVVVVPA